MLEFSNLQSSVKESCICSETLNLVEEAGIHKGKIAGGSLHVYVSMYVYVYIYIVLMLMVVTDKCQ